MQTAAAQMTDSFVVTKNYSFKDFQDRKYSEFPKAGVSKYLYMYERAREKKAPVILELGTRRGISTTMFLQACQENGGRLFSVDIEDFSDVSNDPDWTFIQSDSSDVEGIVAKHAALKDGIDILLIDSLHKRTHVEKELYGWSKYMKKNSFIFFDDVDPNVFRKGHRKDHALLEHDWQNMQDCVLDAFHNNEEDCTLEIHYGSTGLAMMKKETDLGVPLKQVKGPYKRTYNCLWRMKHSLIALKSKILGHPY